MNELDFFESSLNSGFDYGHELDEDFIVLDDQLSILEKLRIYKAEVSQGLEPDDSGNINDQILLDIYKDIDLDHEYMKELDDDKYNEIIKKIYKDKLIEFDKKSKEEEFKRALFLDFRITEDRIFEDIKIAVAEKYFIELDQDLYKGEPSNKKIDTRRQYKKLLNIIVANLYNAYYKRLLLLVNRNKSYYVRKKKNGEVSEKYFGKRENLEVFSYTMVTRIFDWMVKKQYVDVRKGFYRSKNKQNTGELTRYLPKGDLLLFIQVVINKFYKEIEPEYSVENSDNILKVRRPKVKGKKGPIIFDIVKDAKFPSKRNDRLKFLEKHKNIIKILNSHLDKTRIVICNPVTFYDKIKIGKLVESRRYLFKLKKNEYVMHDNFKHYCRIFNDSRLDRGGRIYAPFQQLSSKTRMNFLINDEKVEGIDIASSHIRMLHHILNIEFEGDAYELMYSPDKDSKMRCKIIRAINKKVLQTIINANTRESAKKSSFQSVKKILKKYDRYDIAKDFNKHGLAEIWMERIIEKHQKIKKFFHSGMGVKLQYKESVLMIKCILELMKLDIPCLCVHDELIVPYSKRDIAREKMEEIYWNDIFPKKKLILEFKSED